MEIDLRADTPKQFRFALHSSDHPLAGSPESIFWLAEKVNDFEWFGCEPNTCKVSDINSDDSSDADGFRLWIIVVDFIPLTFLWDEIPSERRRRRGHLTECVEHDSATGELLDLEGNVLSDDDEPKWTVFETQKGADYRMFDFGQFLLSSDFDPNERKGKVIE